MHIITKFNTPKSRRWNHIFSKNLRKIRKEVQTSPNLLLEFYIKVYEKSVKCFWLFAHNYKIHYTYRERIKVRLFKKFTENKELVTNWEPNLVAALQFLRFCEYFSLSVLAPILATAIIKGSNGYFIKSKKKIIHGTY